MRIWGSIEDLEGSLKELKKKLRYFTSEMMVVVIEESYQFSFDKIQRNVLGVYRVQNLSELLQIDTDPIEFQVLDEEFVAEKYTSNGTVYFKCRKWNNPSVKESEEILLKNDISEVFRNSSPIGKEFLRLM